MRLGCKQICPKPKVFEKKLTQNNLIIFTNFKNKKLTYNKLQLEDLMV